MMWIEFKDDEENSIDESFDLFIWIYLRGALLYSTLKSLEDWKEIVISHGNSI